MDLTRILVALGAAAAVSMLAWRLGALREGGAVAATFVGAAVFGFGGLGAAVVLVFFFTSASVLSGLPPKSSRAARGARQVLANGLVAAIACILAGVHPLATIAFLGSVAAATADTWATEVGTRLGKTPRSILTLRRQPPGTSGAISLPGTAAALAGALAVAVAGEWLMSGLAGRAILAVASAGFLGSLVDSILGAGLQAGYRCPTCGARPEVARHDGCATRAVRVSGVPGLDNDVVNLAATCVGAATALVLLTLT